MREIEIKAKLVDKESVIKKLQALGCVFEPVITQNDIIYVRNGESLKEHQPDRAVLRIRVKNNQKVLFTAKRKMANNLDAIEYEVEVSSKEEMEQALLLMGYLEVLRIHKTRIITHHNGCEIYIDDVEGLGMFIEMEKLAEEGDSQEIQEELFKFFESIGIAREDRVLFGYDILTLQKNES